MSEDNKIYLLSGNKKTYSGILKDFLPAKDIQKYVIDLNDFIAMNQEDFPELINFMGFEEEIEEETFTEIESSKRIYPDHLTFDQMVLGVKQGLYFQGRMNVNRLVQTEATVKIQGLS